MKGLMSKEIAKILSNPKTAREFVSAIRQAKNSGTKVKVQIGSTTKVYSTLKGLNKRINK